VADLSGWELRRQGAGGRGQGAGSREQGAGAGGREQEGILIPALEPRPKGVRIISDLVSYNQCRSEAYGNWTEKITP